MGHTNCKKTKHNQLLVYILFICLIYKIKVTPLTNLLVDKHIHLHVNSSYWCELVSSCLDITTTLKFDLLYMSL